MKRTLIIGTRSSKLAIWQALYVKSFLLDNFSDIAVEIKEIQTTGDKNLHDPIGSFGGKGIFLKEIPDKKTWFAILITFFSALYIFYDSIQLGNFFGDFMGLVTATGLAVNAVLVRSAKDRDLLPSAVLGKLCVAIFAFLFVDSFSLVGNDIIYIPLMCILCVAMPFVLVTIAPRFIPAEEVNLFFLLETIIGPLWVWMIIKEQPSIETIQGGMVIILTIAFHSFLKIRKNS